MMPNTLVLAAATGLPATRAPLAQIMLQAHAEAREASTPLSYRERFALALRYASRAARKLSAPTSAA